MGPALFLIAQLYRVEDDARPLRADDRLRLRQLQSRPILDKLRGYLEETQLVVLPKSPAGRAVRHTLKNWTAPTRYCEDGDLQIGNATERAIRGVAVGRNNWLFFGSDGGGKTAAVLRSFVASCQRADVEPFAWFKDVLSRIAAHPITRIAELCPTSGHPASPNEFKARSPLIGPWLAPVILGRLRLTHGGARMFSARRTAMSTSFVSRPASGSASSTYR